MNTVHEILGNMVEELICEDSDLDYETIKERAMIEFLLAANSSRTIEEKLLYRQMLKLFDVNQPHKI